uniref:Membrane protein n=3 Tax=Pseudomonadota TaxID=1224 RepID=A0A1C9HZB1_RHILT|nr:membrane protein [Rhizobium leguminosarum bv. trifolii]
MRNLYICRNSVCEHPCCVYNGVSRSAAVDVPEIKGLSMYRGRLERDLSLWVGKGLLGQETAGALLAEYDSRPASFSLGRVLMALAAVLLAAAILLVVASNWEAIPRLVRVGGILALIWLVHIAAARMLARGATAAAGGLLVIGAMSFGGAISLVGQMYHLSGDEQTVMYLWFAIATISAILFRSGAVAVVAGFLSWASFAVYLENNDTHWIGFDPWMAPLMAVIVIGLVRYTGAERARHLSYLLLIGWLAWLYTLYEEIAVALAFAIGGMAAFVLTAVPLPRIASLIRSAGAAPAFYSFLVAVIGFLLLHIEIEDGWRLVVLGVATLAASVLAIALHGRDNGAVRYLAYATFAAEMLYLASVTVGSILGTSSLFLFSGLVVALVALSTPRCLTVICHFHAR